MIKLCVFSKSFLFFGIIILQTTLLLGQNAQKETNSSTDTIFKITYIGQFPAESNKNKETEETVELYTEQPKRKNWLSNLIFGKKPSALVAPISVLANSPDTLWILDQGNGSINNGINGVGEITQFKNNKNIIFPSLVASCFFANNDILFTDSQLNKIFKFNPINKTVELLNDTLTLNKPTGIAYSSVNKEIWVVETNLHRLVVLNEKGELIKQIGKRGNAPGEFNYPTFIWIDNLGIVYVIDTLNSRVQMFNQKGELIDFFGKAGDALGSFVRPKGIATDSFGHIYVVDGLFNNVQVFDKIGKLLSAFGSKGSGKEEFLMPVGIYIDSNNYIYLADSHNFRIQIFKLESTK